ncbi:uncharacterized protein [Periplaneta americana]|uniref:uncharacterized protein n=1 Tax=Periplaneta americana TaxID=6978 RepID=UPI0037E9242E
MMGRTSDEEGETSAKTCRSDDSSDRPLKKARYLWQIKGKYHLKKPEHEDGAKLYLADETKDGYTLHPIEMSHCESGKPGSDGGSADSTNNDVQKPEIACLPSPMVSAVVSPVESEDLNPLQLQKWQARQVARCFVDNTINRVLEDMGFIPLAVDADDLMENFDMSEIRRNDEHLEDAAVMMAIHSHGLQRAVADMRGGNQNLNSVAVTDSCVCNFSLDSVGLQNGLSDDHMRRWYEQSPRDVLNNTVTHEVCPMRANRSQFNPKWANTEDLCDNQHEKDMEANATFTSRNSLGEELDSKSVDVGIVGNDDNSMFNSDMNFGDELEERSNASFEHTDFLDKAVAVAIQKKGLSTLSGIEYG